VGFPGIDRVLLNPGLKSPVIDRATPSFAWCSHHWQSRPARPAQTRATGLVDRLFPDEIAEIFRNLELDHDLAARQTSWIGSKRLNELCVADEHTSLLAERSHEEPTVASDAECPDLGAAGRIQGLNPQPGFIAGRLLCQ